MNQYKFESGFNMRMFVIVLSVVLLVSYGLFNARNLITGPVVEIFNPTGSVETGENVLTVKGKATNITSISLNEKPIFVDKEGLFEEKLLLSPGSNTIEIKAGDRFKKEIKKTITIYYKQGTTTPASETVIN
jgi:hypothetical protein